MRENKFMVWDTKTKTHPSEIFLLFTTGELFTVDPLRKTLITCEAGSEKGRYIVRFYTGLKDKNGKECYEGDIVRSELGDIAHIVYSTKCGILGGFTYQYRSAPKGLFDWDDKIFFEIIGNIYENPEMVKL